MTDSDRQPLRPFGVLLNEYRPRVRAALEPVAAEVDAPLDDAVDAVLTLLTEYADDTLAAGLHDPEYAAERRVHYTSDGRPRTSPNARGELEKVLEAARYYEDVHADDWPCLASVPLHVGGVLDGLAPAPAPARTTWTLYEFSYPPDTSGWSTRWPECPADVRAVVERVLEDFDGASCPRCANTIGGYLREDEETLREASAWYAFYVVTDGEQAWPACEDCCSPMPLPDGEVNEPLARAAARLAERAGQTAPEQVDTVPPAFRVVCDRGCCDLPAADWGEADRKMADAKSLARGDDHGWRVEVHVGGGWEPAF